MNRRYLVYVALGVVFLSLGSSGHSKAYYGAAIAFFAVALILWRRSR